MIDVNYAEYKETIAENMELIIKNHKLKEDLEYSNYCNEQLSKKIKNLEYKIAILEEKIKNGDDNE